MKKTLTILALSCFLTVLVTGCTKAGSKDAKVELKPSVVTIDGSDITVGVTTVQEAEDMGFIITGDKNLESYLLEDAKLPARTYDDLSETKYPNGQIYSFSFNIDDSYVQVNFNLETGLTQDIKVNIFDSKF